MVSFLFYTNIVLFIFVCLILIMLILIQKGRGGGLSGAFGGGAGSTAFGAKTGDVLTWATSIVFGVFVLLAITLNLLTNYRHAHESNGLTFTPTPAIPLTAPTNTTPAAPLTPATPATPTVETPSTQPAH